MLARGVDNVPYTTWALEEDCLLVPKLKLSMECQRTNHQRAGQHEMRDWECGYMVEFSFISTRKNAKLNRLLKYQTCFLHLIYSSFKFVLHITNFFLAMEALVRIKLSCSQGSTSELTFTRLALGKDCFCRHHYLKAMAVIRGSVLWARCTRTQPTSFHHFLFGFHNNYADF